MTRDVELAALYRGRINVWVEDSVSEAYLREVWSDPDIRFLVGAGKTGVLAILGDADHNQVGNVFAVVDRDFDDSNHPNWMEPSKTFRRFVPPVHEIENYLLDAQAWVESDINSNKRTADHIETLLRSTAERMTWWMAASHVIDAMRRAALDDFISRPSLTQAVDLASVVDAITSSTWFKQVLARIQPLVDHDDVVARVTEAERQYAADLESGEYLRSFSGKELFRVLRGDVYQSPDRGASSSVADTDAAKTIGRWQRDHNCVPHDLVELHTSIRLRVELA